LEVLAAAAAVEVAVVLLLLCLPEGGSLRHLEVVV
jgi:hypothetical protein